MIRSIYLFSKFIFLLARVGEEKGRPPYLSTPKVLMIPWVSAETMKAEKAFAPATFTFGHFTGLTSMTW